MPTVGRVAIVHCTGGESGWIQVKAGARRAKGLKGKTLTTGRTTQCALLLERANFVVGQCFIQYCFHVVDVRHFVMA